MTIAVKRSTIYPNSTINTPIADEIPMDAGFVLAAGFGIARAYSLMNDAVNLFVEMDVVSKAINTVVDANSKLAQAASRDHHPAYQQKGSALSVLNTERDVCWQIEQSDKIHPAVDRNFHGAVKISPLGMFGDAQRS